MPIPLFLLHLRSAVPTFATKFQPPRRLRYIPPSLLGAFSIKVFTTATLSYPPFSRETVSPLQLFIPPTPQSSYPSPTLSAADKYPLPSLDPSQGQQAHYWGGSSSGASSTTASSPSILAPSLVSNTSPPSLSYLQSAPFNYQSSVARTLPTPPTTSDAETRPFPPPARDEISTLAATLAQSSSLMSTHDMSSGLAARRQQHPLPQFHLNTTRAPYSSFGGNSVLTPPPIGPNEITSPLSSGGSSAGTVSAMGPFSPVGYWPATSNSSPYGYGSASTNASYTSGGIQSSTNSSFGVRGFASPGVTLNRGNSRPSSPATGELVHPPSFDNSSPYTSGMPISTGAGGHPTAAVAGSGLPSIGPGSNVHSSYAAAYLQPSQHSNQPHPPINNQSQQNHDPYSPQGSLPPPTPSQPYYGQQQQQQGLQMSPSSVMGRQMNSGHQYPPLVPLQPNYKPQYPLPGVGGQVMGGILHGHPAMMPHHHPGAHHQQQAERPFKCDQCPQSFNRNHDLKRHKRIHLAVKPFPCNNCEKSFSRKDALKRHRLVKGCGKNDHLQGQSSPVATGQDSKQSPSVSPINTRNPGPEPNTSPPGSAGGMIKHDR